jgi:hypothetical protein
VTLQTRPSLREGAQKVFRKVFSNNPEYPLLGNQPLLDEVETAPVSGGPTEEIQLSDPPAEPPTLRVMNPIVRVPVGGAGVVRLAMDAPDDYISPEPGVGKGAFSATFTRGTNLFRTTGFSALRKGIMRITIATDKGVPVGERGKVIFTIMRSSGLPLLAEAEVITVQPPPARVKPVGTKVGPEPGPNVQGVDREGWLELGLSEDVVAKLEENPATQSITIYVHKEYPQLMARLRRERDTDPENLVSYQSKFVAAMALAAWLQYQDQKTSDTQLDQEILEGELRRTAQIFFFTEYVAKDKITE